MQIVWIALMIVLALALLVLAASYVCFYITFYVPEKSKKPQKKHTARLAVCKNERKKCRFL